MTVIKSYQCAIYTRKSHEEGLEQAFNSLDAQREAGEAYVQSQLHEKWQLVTTRYDDGGFSGGNIERPALKQLLIDIEGGKIDIIVVYKVDRLSRSLNDFAKLMELFDKHGVSFVSVTQQFNTTTSMGRLTLNMLLSFAQFEREVTSERIRDKLAASKKKGMWVGGVPPYGYEAKDRKLFVKEAESFIVRDIYQRYMKGETPLKISTRLNEQGIGTKAWVTKKGHHRGGGNWTPKQIHRMLTNPIYCGKIKHKEEVYEGEHEGILPESLWGEVQEVIHNNWRKEKGQQERQISGGYPLKGLVRLKTGEALSPSRTNTTRYYVSQRAIKLGRSNCEIKSLNAQLLEDIVLAYALSVLPNGIRDYILQEYGRAKQDGWLVVRRLIEEVTISSRALWLRLSKSMMDELAEELRVKVFDGDKQEEKPLVVSNPYEVVYPADVQEKGDRVTCKVAIQIKRHDGRRYLLAPDGNAMILPNTENLSHGSTTYQSKSILKAVSEVHTWREQLEDGKITVKELAKQTGKSESYMHGRLRLLYLSPTILKRITHHSLSPIISLKDLLKAAHHLDWKLQHHYLSIPHK